MCFFCVWYLLGVVCGDVMCVRVGVVVFVLFVWERFVSLYNIHICIHA
jgi:hypothetical protein